MRRIKASVNIKLPKRTVISRTEKPSEFIGVSKKYKYLILEDGILENYYESKLHM
jgi:hypothetical protein|tara:strand:- start:140 stop:304 length:165 start_codon:yes stop_codon:yes gene_type:complete